MNISLPICSMLKNQILMKISIVYILLLSYFNKLPCGMKRPTLHSPMQLLWFAVKSIYHTPRLTESVTKINLAYSNDCYTRFASPHNVQSRA